MAGSSSSGSRSPGFAATEADIRLVVAAIKDEENARTFAQTALSRFPRQRDVLTPILAVQSAHVDRLRGTLVRVRVSPATVSPNLPREAEDLTAALVHVESRLSSDREADCLAAHAGPLAKLFGSMRASHAVQLTTLGATPTGLTPRVTPPSIRDVSPFEPCLSAEYAAVFGYGVVGGAVAAGVSEGPVATAARESYDVHRARRDALVNLFAAAGRRAPAAQPAYRIPFEVSGPTSARRLAGTIESRCAAVYLQAVGVTAGAGRHFASDVVTDCARSAVIWGASPSAFPGLPATP
jgi:hypothetical protein